MNETPFHHLLVWRNKSKKLNGSNLSIFEYLALVGKSSTSLHSFTGRTATVCVLSNAFENITRQEKLQFAINFLEGNYVSIAIDLKELSYEIVHGNPPPGY